MIVICEECGKNHRIDPEKIKSKEVRFKCSDCGHQISARKPISPEKTPETHAALPPSKDDNSTDLSTSEKITAKTAVKKKSDKKKRKPIFAQTPRIRFGLTAKLFTIMIIISLVPSVMFWGITLKKTKDSICYEVKKNTNQQFSRMVRDLDEWFYKKARIIKSLAMMEEIISMDKKKQEPLLNAVKNIHPDMDLTFVTDVNGMVVAGNDGRSFVKHANQKYYHEIIGGKNFAWQTLIDKASKTTGLMLAVPIKIDNAVVGIIASFMTVDSISGQILILETSKTGFALLLRDKGQIIVKPAVNTIPKNKQLLWQPLITGFRNGQSGPMSFNDPAGKSVLAYVGKTAFGWGIALQTEEKEAFFMIDQLMSFAYLLLAITVVFVFIIAWFSGRALSRPIIKLTDAADRISVGELEMEIRTKRKDEIGDLAEAIARMQDSIRLSIERLRRRR